MPLGIVGEGVRRVETHRLVVEQRAVELSRVIVLQPARLVGQHGEGGRVRFREAVGSETEQLVEDRRAISSSTPLAAAPLRNSSQKRSMAASERLRLIERRKEFSLSGGEASQLHRHLQHLLLIQDHAMVSRSTGSSSGWS